MKITVLGSGYAGLIAGTYFAGAGHQVIYVDVDPGKAERRAP